MKSFKYAFRGIADTIRTEHNMRVHLCFAFYVIIAGFVTHISLFEWAAVLICIGAVMALECLNTAVESLCDTVSPEKSDGIRMTKDASAGAVLCAALASAFVGGIIFFNEQKIAAAIDFLKNQTLLSILIILSLIPLCFFVRARKRERK
jgi:diacylglycerol kinase (ATP)